MKKVHTFFTNFLFTWLFHFFVIQAGVEAARLRRVVNGEKADSSEIFYQASLKVNEYHVCGGTIITEKHILTAAHCVAGLVFPPYEDLTVVTGSEYLQGGNHHVVFNVSWHKNFLNGLDEVWWNDIAVITLKEKIMFTDRQHAAYLPESPVTFHEVGVFSGFGRTVTLNPYLSKVLLKGTATIINNDECQLYMKPRIRDGQICGVAEKGVGICKGDSGGPFVVDKTVIGIASWNIPCGTGVPDVYTDVYSYLDFIEEIINRP